MRASRASAIGLGVGAELAAGQLAAVDLDPVRPQQAQGQRQAGDCRGLVVAHQRRQVHRFARAVDAAIGIEIGVDRPRLRPAADPAVGQVEGGAADLEEVEIAVWAIGHDREGLVAAAAVQQPAGDAGEPVGIARDRRQARRCCARRAAA